MSDFNPLNGTGSGNGGQSPVNLNYERFKGKMPFLIFIAVAAILAFILLLNSYYIVDSGKEAVITRFGRYTHTERTPGLRMKIPFADDAAIVDTSTARRMEFGYRSDRDGDYFDESRMLTSDENLVIADWTIQYRVEDGYSYLFNVSDPESTLRIICESTYRRVVASYPLDSILTDQKDIIQNEIQRDLQDVVDKYNMGIVVSAVQLQDAMPPDEVKVAFLDVTSAMEDKNAKINEARRYENEQLPLARGNADKILNEAEAYKQSRIYEAEGSVARYKSIEAEYLNMPEIMMTRMYLEMIQTVLPQVKSIYIVDSESNTLNFLPLAGFDSQGTSGSSGGTQSGGSSTAAEGGDGE